MSDSIFIFAARYAHGRNTGAALFVVTEILRAWDTLSDNAKFQLYKESYEASYCKLDWDRLREKWENDNEDNATTSIQ